ncbi:MAG: hypothetical protein R3E32_19890 [Chitinophagales bacterium]
MKNRHFRHIIQVFVLCWQNFFIKIPRRLWRLAVHFFKPSALKKWQCEFPVRSNFGLKMRYVLLGIIAWAGRLFTKIFDLLGLGEFWTFWWTVFQPNCRPLNELELIEAKRVFKDSLPYDLIQIHENSPLAYMGARRIGALDLGICICYTIHFTRSIYAKEGNNDMAWLIHELVHVAQLEYVGTQYMTEALHAQATTGYDYGGPTGIEGKQFMDFNREQQGCIPADYYMYVLYDREHHRFGYMSFEVYFPLIEALRKGKI